MAIQQKKESKTETAENRLMIPMIDLKGQYEALRDEIDNTLREILESGHFVLGEHVDALEKEISEYHNVNYAVSLASCTDALHLSLKALGIKDGDEVITTPFTFIAAAEAIVYVGAKPVFVDIDKNTLNIDPSKIHEKITQKTRAILPVHLFGLPADMEELTETAKKFNLKVIEDCAQSFGAKYKGAVVGSLGDAGCYSFYPSKNLGGCGDGGMLITNSRNTYERVKLLRNHGSKMPYKHSFIGYNSRLDEIQAAILRIKLKHIDEYNQKRRNLAQIYSSIINAVSSEVQCPTELSDRVHVYHQYTIRSGKRPAIQKAFEEKFIFSVVYYPVPLHLQDAFRYLGYKENDFPESEAAAKEVLSVPIYPELEPEKAEFIANTIVKAVRD